VKAALLQAVAGVEGVRTSPAPEVVVTGYGDFAIGYDMRVWINDYAHVEQIRDAIMSRLWYSLRRAGMSIPFPIRDVNLHTIGDDHAAQADARMRRDIFNVLRPLPLFEPLDDSQIDQLAQNAVLQRYTRGESLVRQGESGSSLFVIKSGQVKVDARGDAGRFTTVNVLGPGDFFGELSLLTGEPRGASVSATMDTEVVVVEKAAFAPVFAADVGIAEALSDALEDRQRVTAEQLALGAQNRSEKISVQRKAMGDRIRSFFGMS
jgi:CRP-like cAMP-binding protein